MKIWTAFAAAGLSCLLTAGFAHAAPFSAQAYLCGGGAGEKDLLVLRKGQVFDLTDVTIANTSSQGRLVAVALGTWPSSTTASSLFAAQVPGGSTFKQQFKTPITYSGGSPIRAKNLCSSDNFAVYVTISGDLR